MKTDYKVVYFHGYGSSPQSEKVKALREHFDVLAPEIPVRFDLAKAYLYDFLCDRARQDDLVLVGTSLGGYWAGVMSNLLALPAILVNPSCFPTETLERYKNEQLTQEELTKFVPLAISSTAPRTVLLAKDDDVLDYRVAQKVLSARCEVKLFETGGHRFNDINTIRSSIIDLQKGFGIP